VFRLRGVLWEADDIVFAGPPYQCVLVASQLAKNGDALSQLVGPCFCFCEGFAHPRDQHLGLCQVALEASSFGLDGAN
jgi:hypothetical protein